MAMVVRDDHIYLILMAALVGVTSGAAAGLLLMWISQAVVLFPTADEEMAWLRWPVMIGVPVVGGLLVGVLRLRGASTDRARDSGGAPGGGGGGDPARWSSPRGGRSGARGRNRADDRKRWLGRTRGADGGAGRDGRLRGRALFRSTAPSPDRDGRGRNGGRSGRRLQCAARRRDLHGRGGLSTQRGGQRRHHVRVHAADRGRGRGHLHLARHLRRSHGVRGPPAGGRADRDAAVPVARGARRAARAAHDDGDHVDLGALRQPQDPELGQARPGGPGRGSVGRGRLHRSARSRSQHRGSRAAQQPRHPDGRAPARAQGGGHQPDHRQRGHGWRVHARVVHGGLPGHRAARRRRVRVPRAGLGGRCLRAGGNGRLHGRDAARAADPDRDDVRADARLRADPAAHVRLHPLGLRGRASAARADLGPDVASAAGTSTIRGTRREP